MRTMPYNLHRSPSGTIHTAINTHKSITDVFNNNSIALSTNKRINSSYDNSSLYFKDVRLSERADGLNSTMESLSSILSIVNSAGKNLDTINDLVELAKSLASSAYDASVFSDKIVAKNFKMKFSDPINEIAQIDLPTLPSGANEKATIMFRTGDTNKYTTDIEYESEKATLSDMGIVAGDSFSIKVGDTDWIDLKVSEDDIKNNITVVDFLGQVPDKLTYRTQDKAGNDIIVDGRENFKIAFEDNKLTLFTADNTQIMIADEPQDDTNIAYKLGFDMSTTKTIKTQNDWTMKTLIQEINSLKDGKTNDIVANLNSNGYLEISSLYGDEFCITDRYGEIAKQMEINKASAYDYNDRKNLASRYDELLEQINHVVDDGIYNGINLLAGDTIKAIYSDDGLNFHYISGEFMDFESLGLTKSVSEWQKESDIQTVLDQLEEATNKLESFAAILQRSSSKISSRSDYMTSLADTYSTGAEKLTIADANEISIEQLTIETQQQLINNVINLTLDSSNGILSLF
ncbi:MAG: hypothetical protein MJ247_05145 [Alphaproteobacteria bacterium]|nr:hypothetical protein [Alphaproteobacteria bacterium]